MYGTVVSGVVLLLIQNTERRRLQVADAVAMAVTTRCLKVRLLSVLAGVTRYSHLD